MKKTILILDNNLEDSKQLSNILSTEYEVVMANSEKKVFELLKGDIKRISAIIFDIVDNNSFNFLEELSKNYRQLPVFVLSSNIDEKVEIKALEYGIADYLIKPYSAKGILHRINNSLSRIELATRLNRIEIDRLTQVYNIDAFYRNSAILLENAKGSEKYFAIVSDIKNFKMINSKYGYNYANKVLKELAKAGKEIVDDFGGLIGRISGDNFAILLKCDVWDQKEKLKEKINKRMLELLNENDFNFSCGIYLIEDNKMDVNKIFDRALIAAKKTNGTNFHYSIYDDSMAKEIEEETFLIKSVENGIPKKEFNVYLQPKFDIEENKMIGAEALVRWKHPKLGFISPAKFIPILEKNGLVGMVDRFVWEEVCKLINKCKEQGIDIPPISINVSRKDLFDKDFMNNIMSILEKYDILPSEVHLEITETAYMENQTAMKRLIKQLLNKGFYLEMDDFGSGYSSLNILNELDFNLLKLDMIFVRNLTNKYKVSLIPFIMNIAKALEVDVLVEGVETQAQLEILKSYGCRYVQGYLYSKPLPEKEFTKLLEGELG